MITLKINDIEVTVPRGSTILDAAGKADVFIPTLCHDKWLTPYGACRLCVVEDRKKPGSLIASCFTPARDRMEILTETPAVLEAVKTQLQLILVNHPLDCPVCDKAGECALQDLVNRYNIRTVPFLAVPAARDIDRSSPLIERNMSRCILCGRCVRICGELQGCEELHFIHRGFRTIVGTDGGRPLDCDFCGLCVSTCPVGAINDKLYKDRTRCWNLEHEVVPCSHCGLGCRADHQAENGRLRRVISPAGEQGEMGLLCVRGRFGWRSYESPARLSVPQIRKDGSLRETDWSEAVAAAATGLSSVRERYGASAIAMLTADHLTTEEAAAARAFFGDVLGCAHVGSLQAEGYRALCASLSRERGPAWAPGTIEDILDCDTLLVLGGGAAEFHPVLKPMINRFLAREGRELVVLSGWPDILARRATLSMAIKPEYEEEFWAEICGAFSGGDVPRSSDATRFGVDTSVLARFVTLLEVGRRITVLVAPSPFGGNEPLARFAALLSGRVQAVIPLGAQVNTAGATRKAGLLSRGAASSADALLEAIETGQIRALHLLGEDPLEMLPDPARVGAALRKLDFIVCQSPFATSVTGMAHVVLPSALLPEKGGTTVSLLGVESGFRPAVSRPGRSRADLDIIRELAGLVAPVSAPGTWTAAERPAGVLPDAPDGVGGSFPFRLLAVPSLFGDTLPARQSPDLAALRPLVLAMASRDFERLGLEERAIVSIRTPFGGARAEVRRDAAVPPGTILLRHAPGCAEGLSLIRRGRRVTPASVDRSAP